MARRIFVVIVELDVPRQQHTARVEAAFHLDPAIDDESGRRAVAETRGLVDLDLQRPHVERAVRECAADDAVYLVLDVGQASAVVASTSARTRHGAVVGGGGGARRGWVQGLGFVAFHLGHHQEERARFVDERLLLDLDLHAVAELDAIVEFRRRVVHLEPADAEGSRVGVELPSGTTHRVGVRQLVLALDVARRYHVVRQSQTADLQHIPGPQIVRTGVVERGGGRQADGLPHDAQRTVGQDGVERPLDVLVVDDPRRRAAFAGYRHSHAGPQRRDIGGITVHRHRRIGDDERPVADAQAVRVTQHAARHDGGAGARRHVAGTAGRTGGQPAQAGDQQRRGEAGGGVHDPGTGIRRSNLGHDRCSVVGVRGIQPNGKNSDSRTETENFPHSRSCRHVAMRRSGGGVHLRDPYHDASRPTFGSADRPYGRGESESTQGVRPTTLRDRREHIGPVRVSSVRVSPVRVSPADGGTVSGGAHRFALQVSGRRRRRSAETRRLGSGNPVEGDVDRSHSRSDVLHLVV